MAKRLTNKQKVFVEEYCNNGWNATKAALAAGYAASSAKLSGHNNITKYNVIQAIEAKKGEISKKIDVTTDEIIAQLRTIAFDTKANKGDILRALELLGKYKGMFTDKGTGQDVKIYLDMSEKGA